MIEKPSKILTKNINDTKCFITSTYITGDGEIANSKKLSLNQDAIEKEAMFDGFYAVCTTLEDNIEEIINVNKRRWEIEESFRILKTEFKARSVYLKNDDRIKAHFTTCFLALLIYRILEYKLNYKFSSNKIISTLQNMNLVKEENFYFPAYTRTDFTDILHNIFGFRTDYEILSSKIIKNNKII